MNLINETHHSCEKREYAFIIFRKYTIISFVCVFVYWEMLMSVLRTLGWTYVMGCLPWWVG